MLSLTPAFVAIDTADPRSLLTLAQAGDAEAFGEICRVYETSLLRHATSLCGDATLAEDLAQDTLVEAWKGLRRYNGRCQFFTWLCAILINRYRNTLRQKRPWRIVATSRSEADNIASIENIADRAVLPDQAAELREEAAVMRMCIDALPAKQRQVIYLRFYVDDSLEGIASALGCSLGTVKSRLFHALDKLRKMNALSSRPRNQETNIRAL